MILNDDIHGNRAVVGRTFASPSGSGRKTLWIICTTIIASFTPTSCWLLIFMKDLNIFSKFTLYNHNPAAKPLQRIKLFWAYNNDLQLVWELPLPWFSSNYSAAKLAGIRKKYITSFSFIFLFCSVLFSRCRTEYFQQFIMRCEAAKRIHCVCAYNFQWQLHCFRLHVAIAYAKLLSESYKLVWSWAKWNKEQNQPDRI